MNADNKIFQAIQLVAVFLLVAALVLWGAVLIPIMVIGLGSLFLVCFAIGWFARGSTLLVKKVASLFKR